VIKRHFNCFLAFLQGPAESCCRLYFVARIILTIHLCAAVSLVCSLRYWFPPLHLMSIPRPHLRPLSSECIMPAVHVFSSSANSSSSLLILGFASCAHSNTQAWQVTIEHALSMLSPNPSIPSSRDASAQLPIHQMQKKRDLPKLSERRFVEQI
jgi:hypothetical protein